MKTVTVAELRQNPTTALDDVERGETYAVTRHRRVIARLVPPTPRRGATPTEYADLLRRSPLSAAEASDWDAEIREDRRELDAAPDPWGRT